MQSRRRNTSRAKDSRDAARLKFPYALSSVCSPSTNLYEYSRMAECTFVSQSVLLPSSVLFFMFGKKAASNTQVLEMDEAAPTQRARYEVAARTFNTSI